MTESNALGSPGSPEPLGNDQAQSLNASLDASITRVKLIGAFKGGDTAQLEQIISERPNVVQYPTLVHLAVQIASVKTIEWLLNKYATDPGDEDDNKIDVNTTDDEGNTPLHLAAMYGRQDVALYLLSLAQINDTITNNRGKQPVEVAKTPELAEVMQISRARYVETVSTKLKQLLNDEDLDGLDSLLSSPRASALLDINGQDPDTGSTVLHDFVRRRRTKMVQFILSHGGDPFRRDRKGVLPIELAKDETIKKMLKNASKEQPVLSSPASALSGAAAGGGGGAKGGPAQGAQPLSGPPRISGYLKKWTNFTGGYKLRWFVLENGVLSYYKRQDDTDRACRGSINMKNATLHLNSSEKTNFEISMKGSSSKFHLRANHPVETNRWIWALTNAIQYAKDQERSLRPAAMPATSQPQHRRAPSSSQGTGPGAASIGSQMTRVGTHSSIGSKSSIARRNSQLSTKTSQFEPAGTSENLAPNGGIRGDDDNSILVVDKPGSGLIENDMRDDYEAEDEEFDDETSSVITSDAPPYDNQQSVLQDTMKVQINALSDLVQSLSSSAKQGNLGPDSLDNGLSTFEQSITALRSQLAQYTKQVEARERYYENKLEQSESQQRLWAQNIRALELEHEKIQGELHQAVRKRKEAAKLLRAHTQTDEVAAARVERTSLLDVSDESDDEFFDVETGPAVGEQPTAGDKEKAPAVEINEETLAEEEKEQLGKFKESVEELTPKQREMYEAILAEESFKGYEDPPRSRLKLDKDDRPKISLWGVLKSLIGKDMTRMTLPVSFNECTNLLQRSAEDMEYTDILDEAAKCLDDPGLRMAHVAAFTASSYSSTINRIAKPFNPLLGETFEYSRPDKGYRLFAEQVSHHPPIGAMIAESARWAFYGESNVKSKFNGRSFDINPLGRWYVVLRPNKGADVEEELYSFRKVTSSVVGIITGSPVVDNYGDMEIINHTLGYKCLLKFKSRGWRGASAYELKGTVVDDKGEPKWIVGGRWNDKIFARPATSGEAEDGTASGAQSPPAIDDASKGVLEKKKLLLWQVHDRPPAPFNLTKFAITLNALPERLQPYLARTDTRLRPDQRAMEEGRYDEASDEKHRVEEKQRAARRAREEKNQTYSPAWFTKEKHPVTGDVYFRPHGDYWRQRRAGKLEELSADIF
uniref:ARAD1B06556p n=1 Tax=Blastobotrys adeninivorans TaxID=409370 RepID=A0A060TAF0_BLAAD